MPDHSAMVTAIPLRYAVSQVVGFVEGKSRGLPGAVESMAVIGQRTLSRSNSGAALAAPVPTARS